MSDQEIEEGAISQGSEFRDSVVEPDHGLNAEMGKELQDGKSMENRVSVSHHQQRPGISCSTGNERSEESPRKHKNSSERKRRHHHHRRRRSGGYSGEDSEVVEDGSRSQRRSDSGGDDLVPNPTGSSHRKGHHERRSSRSHKSRHHLDSGRDGKHQEESVEHPMRSPPTPNSQKLNKVKMPNADTEDGEILEDGELDDDDVNNNDGENAPLNDSRLSLDTSIEDTEVSPNKSHSHTKEEVKSQKREKRKQENRDKRKKDSEKKKRKKYVDMDKTADAEPESVPVPAWGSGYQVPRSKSSPQRTRSRSPSFGKSNKNVRAKGQQSPPGLYDSPSYSEDSDEEQFRASQAMLSGGYLDASVAADEKEGVFKRVISFKKKKNQSGMGKRRAHEFGKNDGPPKKKALTDMAMADRPKCKFFKDGKCAKGAACPFSHDIEQAKRMEVCKYHLTVKGCHKERCLYMHEDFPCRFYHTGAHCFAGDRCKFSHAPLTMESRRSLKLRVAPEDIIGMDEPDYDSDYEYKQRNYGSRARPSLLGSSPTRHSLRKIPSLFDIEVHPPNQSPKPSPSTVRPSGFYNETASSPPRSAHNPAASQGGAINSNAGGIGNNGNMGNVPGGIGNHGNMGNVPGGIGNHGNMGNVPGGIGNNGNMGNISGGIGNHGNMGNVPGAIGNHGNMGNIPGGIGNNINQGGGGGGQGLLRSNMNNNRSGPGLLQTPNLLPATGAGPHGPMVGGPMGGNNRPSLMANQPPPRPGMPFMNSGNNNNTNTSSNNLPPVLNMLGAIIREAAMQKVGSAPPSMNNMSGGVMPPNSMNSNSGSVPNVQNTMQTMGAGNGGNNMNNVGLNNMNSVHPSSMNNMSQSNMNSMGQNNMGNMGQNNMGNMRPNNVNNMGQNSMGNMGLNNMGNMGQNNMNNMGQNSMGNMGQNSMGNMGQNNMTNMGQNSMGNMGQNNMGQNSMGNIGQNNMGNIGQNNMGNIGQNNMGSMGVNNMGPNNNNMGRMMPGMGQMGPNNSSMGSMGQGGMHAMTGVGMAQSVPTNNSGNTLLRVAANNDDDNAVAPGDLQSPGGNRDSREQEDMMDVDYRVKQNFEDNDEASKDLSELDSMRRRLQEQIQQEDAEEEGQQVEENQDEEDRQVIDKTGASPEQKETFTDSGAKPVSDLTVDSSVDTIEIPTHLPKKQRELFIRIQQQHLLREKEKERQEALKSTEEVKENVDKDDWYSSSDEDEEDKAKTSKEVPMKDKSKVTSTAGNVSPSAPATAVSSTFNIMQMINAIRKQNPTTSDDSKSTGGTSQVSSSAGQKMESPASPPTSPVDSPIFHPPPRAVEPPVVSAIPSRPLKYAIVRIALNMPKTYTILPINFDASNPAYRFDPRVKRHFQFTADKQAPLTPPLTREKEARRASVDSAEKPAKLVDPRLKRGPTTDPRLAKMGGGSPNSVSVRPADDSRPMDPRLKKDSVPTRPVDPRLAKRAANASNDPRLNRQISQEPGIVMMSGQMNNMGGPMNNMGGPMSNMGGPMNNMGGPMNNMGGPMNNMGGPMNNMGGSMNSIGGSMNSIGGSMNNMGGPMNSMGGPMNSIGGPMNNMGGPMNKIGGPLNNMSGSMNNMSGSMNNMGGPIMNGPVRPMQGGGLMTGMNRMAGSMNLGGNGNNSMNSMSMPMTNLGVPLNSMANRMGGANPQGNMMGQHGPSPPGGPMNRMGGPRGVPNPMSNQMIGSNERVHGNFPDNPNDPRRNLRQSSDPRLNDPRLQNKAQEMQDQGVNRMNDPRSNIGSQIVKTRPADLVNDPRLANDPRKTSEFGRGVQDDPRGNLNFMTEFSQEKDLSSSKLNSKGVISALPSLSSSASLPPLPSLSPPSSLSSSISPSFVDSQPSSKETMPETQKPAKKFDYRNDPRFKRVKRTTAARQSSMEYSSPLGGEEGEAQNLQDPAGSQKYNSYNRPKLTGSGSPRQQNVPSPTLPDTLQDFDMPDLPPLSVSEPDLKVKDLFKAIDPTASPFC